MYLVSHITFNLLLNTYYLLKGNNQQSAELISLYQKTNTNGL
ncbi:hypothetical protein KL86DYS1_11738 [uncultured Dysgonomonas sp.]|uniref:Uncharacterized protein n=1 Tax=uncultured Dysgonomonas sp. TaxID=206096 RepID=A0A212JC15_9BACT|nr:hypothetical protein KL86DYS1_10269 [uncultured Dysgonomonas sp.]SBV96795.1 hypothetical protein KL86DYS1_11738 [uncultured Dysgonomonas sp.]